MKRSCLGACLVGLALPTLSRAQAPPAPADSSLQLWLRADIGVTVDATGGVELWETNQIVRSGERHDAVQPNPSSRPTRSATGIGGQAALTFNQQFLTAPVNFDPGTTPDVTMLVVFTSKTAATTRRGLLSQDDGGYDRTIGLDDRSGTNFGYFTGSTAASFFTLAVDTPYVVSAIYTPGTFSGWLNGIQKVDAAPVANGNGLSVLHIGGNVLFGEFWLGDIAEVIVYDRVLTAPERQSLEIYLMRRYGIVNPSVSVGAADPSQPARFALQPNSPNPFNPTTTLRYELASSGPVRLEVFDALGQLVRTLVDGAQSAGAHSVAFDGTGLASGLYVARLTSGSTSQARRMILVK